MGKDKLRQSRALHRLEAYNKSPHAWSKDHDSGSCVDVRTVYYSSVGSSGRRNKSHGSHSRSWLPAHNLLSVHCLAWHGYQLCVRNNYLKQ